MIPSPCCCHNRYGQSAVQSGAVRHAAQHTRRAAREQLRQQVNLNYKIFDFPFSIKENFLRPVGMKLDAIVTLRTQGFRRSFLRKISAAGAGESESLLSAIYGALGAAGHSLVG